MRDNERQSAIILSVIGIVPVVWLALLIAPSVKGGLPEILPSLMNVFNNPFHIEVCEDSVKTVLILLLYLRQLYRCKKAGTRTEIVCSLCHCQRCHNLRYGAYACFIQYCSRYHFNHYDIIGIWNTESDDAPIRNGNNH